jgi:phosphate transport system substrate-binding protein
MSPVTTMKGYHMKVISMALLSIALMQDQVCSEDGLTIHGSGSTFIAPLMKVWVKAYQDAHPDVSIVYEANGSGLGITDICSKTVVFAGSDAPLTDKEMQEHPGILHIPVIAGPEVLVYHDDRLPTNLVFDGEVISAIYLGKISNWNDARIQALNPGVSLPDQDLIVVHRSDGSGSTWIFTNYLSKVSSEWNDHVGCGKVVLWPVGVGGRGNQGVAHDVKSTVGSIGYVELAFAQQLNLPYARLINHDKKVVTATIDGVMEAINHTVGGIPDDLRVSITDAPGDLSYPLAGFSYLVVYQDLSYINDLHLEAQIVDFIHWCANEGQPMAAPNYGALSSMLRKRVNDKLKSIIQK